MAMGDVVGALTLIPMEDLNNPNCKISGYAKQLIEYYQYQGMFDNIELADEEFQMLLEPTNHPNFRNMFGSSDKIVTNIV